MCNIPNEEWYTAYTPRLIECISSKRCFYSYANGPPLWAVSFMLLMRLVCGLTPVTHVTNQRACNGPIGALYRLVSLKIFPSKFIFKDNIGLFAFDISSCFRCRNLRIVVLMVYKKKCNGKIIRNVTIWSTHDVYFMSRESSVKGALGPSWSIKSWWRHQMETSSALLALCAGNSPVNGELPAQRTVTRNFEVFFDLDRNKRLSKQSRRRWFETQSRSLWRQCNVHGDKIPWGLFSK